MVFNIQREALLGSHGDYLGQAHCLLASQGWRGREEPRPCPWLCGWLRIQAAEGKIPETHCSLPTHLCLSFCPNFDIRSVIFLCMFTIDVLEHEDCLKFNLSKTVLETNSLLDFITWYYFGLLLNFSEIIHTAIKIISHYQRKYF